MLSLKEYFLHFPRDAWAEFRKDTPLYLTPEDMRSLQGQNETVSIDEVEAIYLPLSRLLNLYVAASQELYQVTSRFLGQPAPRVPYIIAVAGSVAVGKSTTSRVLQSLLSRWPSHPRVEIITTDGYLYPTRVLEEQNLMHRKGFPESYNTRALLHTLAEIKAGVARVRVPVYSHHTYDIVPDAYQVVEQPDIVLVEGLNVLQTGVRHARRHVRMFVSDFFDFSIYVHAPRDVIKTWYLQRFMLFRDKARLDEQAFFHRFAHLTDVEALTFAERVWTETNEQNLVKNILPFGERARLILEKGTDHRVENVYLRRA